jgi:threonine/homoserine/homoserine lactone efflux protein
MHWTRIVGIALLVGGLVLLFMGWQATDSFTEDVAETLTGQYTESTRQYLIGGAIATVVGAVMLVFGAKR